MDRKELSAIVDTVVAAWQVDIADRKTMYRTWFRYLSDLDFEMVLAAVDAKVVAGERWAPRVGEIRRDAIDRLHGQSRWPDAETAWQFVEDRLEAANSGFTAAPHGDSEVDEAIGRAMRTCGTRNGFHKQAFIRAWNNETVLFEQTRYGLAADAPGVLPE